MDKTVIVDNKEHCSNGKNYCMYKSYSVINTEYVYMCSLFDVRLAYLTDVHNKQHFLRCDECKKEWPNGLKIVDKSVML